MLATARALRVVWTVSQAEQCYAMGCRLLNTSPTPILHTVHLVECYVLNLLIESQAQLRHVTEQALHHNAANNIVAQHSTYAYMADSRPAAHAPKLRSLMKGQCTKGRQECMTRPGKASKHLCTEMKTTMKHKR